jgi:hypothetical protein
MTNMSCMLAILSDQMVETILKHSWITEIRINFFCENLPNLPNLIFLHGWRLRSLVWSCIHGYE